MTHECIEQFAAAPSFPQPEGEPCYPSPIDNDGTVYFSPMLLHARANEVRVGGIPWNHADSFPAPGEWQQDRARGLIRLGTITLGGRVIVYLSRLDQRYPE